MEIEKTKVSLRELVQKTDVTQQISGIIKKHRSRFILFCVRKYWLDCFRARMRNLPGKVSIEAYLEIKRKIAEKTTGPVYEIVLCML